jgi:hypothetical protein
VEWQTTAKVLPAARTAPRVAELVVRGKNHQDFHQALLSLVVDKVVRAAVLAARWIVVGRLRGSI